MSDIITQLIINSIIAGSLYSLVAIGFNIIYGVTRFFNLAHGAMATIGAYVVLFLAGHMGMHVIPSIIIAVMVVGGVGWTLKKVIYTPLQQRKASNMALLVASLGAFTALQGIIAILFTSRSQTLSSHIEVQGIYNVAGATVTQAQILIILSAFITSVGLILLLKYTMFGKKVRAINDDVEVSKIIGINTDKIIGIIFFIGSAIAGLAGILVGIDTAIEPTMGMSLLLKGVIAAIIGGVGSIYGAVLGAFLLGFVENFGVWKISGEWKDAVAFGLLTIFLIIRPRGILNKK